MQKFIYSLALYLTSSFLYGQQINFNWLVGTWKYNTGRGQIIETWKKLNDSVYLGKSVFANEKDTALQENVEIIRSVSSDTIWYYIPTVKNQNDNQPVRFKIIFQRGFEFICENPAHDFPQRISYRRYLPRYLHASIEGNRKGKYAKQNFNFYAEEQEELFVYLLRPNSHSATGHVDDITLANALKRHGKFIDSLAVKNRVILGGFHDAGSDKPVFEIIVLKAENMESAKAIIQKDPVLIMGTHKSELSAFHMNNWFPGIWGRPLF